VPFIRGFAPREIVTAVTSCRVYCHSIGVRFRNRIPTGRQMPAGQRIQVKADWTVTCDTPGELGVKQWLCTKAKSIVVRIATHRLP